MKRDTVLVTLLFIAPSGGACRPSYLESVSTPCSCPLKQQLIDSADRLQTLI